MFKSRFLLDTPQKIAAAIHNKTPVELLYKGSIADYGGLVERQTAAAVNIDGSYYLKENHTHITFRLMRNYKYRNLGQTKKSNMRFQFEFRYHNNMWNVSSKDIWDRHTEEELLLVSGTLGCRFCFSRMATSYERNIQRSDE